MEAIQRKKMLWRIPLVAAILVAIFWGIWSFFGQVPATDHLQITEKWTLQLPFSVSRWWDVLFASIWAFILVLIFSSGRIKKDEDLGAAGLVIGLVFSLVFGLIVALVFGLVFGLIVALGVGLGTGLAAGLIVVLLEFIFGKKVWVSLGHWVVGK